MNTSNVNYPVSSQQHFQLMEKCDMLYHPISPIQYLHQSKIIRVPPKFQARDNPSSTPHISASISEHIPMLPAKPIAHAPWQSLIIPPAASTLSDYVHVLPSFIVGFSMVTGRREAATPWSLRLRRATSALLWLRFQLRMIASAELTAAAPTAHVVVIKQT
ncbi:hypothetical protein J1N35_004062 [Gossypium stocksii]|uniref:Uncharacterized protein n=1 Tax=Gossypium stocksii TaxID=47602 RepID=A0A9D4AFP1_9ROSI|nr:hypothetical protein J1N35_004062 [Gossypium stocksii]